MKKLIAPLVVITLMLLACNISINTTPEANNPPEITTAPVVTVPPVVTNVTCNELSIYLDPALASGYNCETKAESPEGIEVFPQHTQLTLQGYVLSNKFFEPHIAVLPVQRYTELLPDFVPGRVAELQALIGGGAVGEALPLLPAFNAGQVFHAQYQSTPFTSGNGIRYLTEYAQYFAPVNNTDLFYTYQGITTDGKYWVSAILPINNPILPADAVNPPGGMTWEAFGNTYDTYITDITTQLNSQISGSFTPSLAALDALAASITILP